MNIIQTFAQLQEVKSKVGDRFTCVERANATYIAQPDGYTPLAGDAVDASGRGLALQVTPEMDVDSFGTDFDIAISDAIDRMVNGTIVVSSSKSTSGVSKTGVTGVDIKHKNNVVITLVDGADNAVYHFTSCNKVRVSGGVVDGNGSNQTTSTANDKSAIFFDTCDGVEVAEIELNDSTSSAVRSLNTQKTKLHKVTGSGAGYIPLYIGPSSSGGVDVDSVRVTDCDYDWSSVDRLISERALLSISSTGVNVIDNVWVKNNKFAQSNNSPSDFHSCINIRVGKHVHVTDNECYNAGLPISIVADCESLVCTGNTVDTETTYYAYEIAGGLTEFVVNNNIARGNSLAATAVQLNATSNKGVVVGNQIEGFTTGIKAVGTSNAARVSQVTFADNNIDVTGKPYDFKYLTHFSVSGGTLATTDPTSVINLESCTKGSIKGVDVDASSSFFIRVAGTETPLSNFHVSGCNLPALSGLDRYIKDTTGGAGIGTNITYKGNSSPIEILDYPDNIINTFGTGAPESSVTAGVGSTYIRTDGGASTVYYVKETGTGNTGWVAK